MKRRKPQPLTPIQFTFLEAIEPRILLAAATYGNGGTPGSGAAWTVPQTGVVRIEAENFNQGGQGVGYSVVAPGNPGGPYRPSDSVAVEATAAASHGYDVTSIDPGEWLEYTVMVAKSGIYTINLGAAYAAAGSTAVTITSAADSSRTVSIAGTGDAHTFASTSTQLELWAGTQVIHIQAGSGGFNLDYLEVGNRATTPLPYTTDWQPWQIAADHISWIESEDFDRGGEGVAYHDTSTANQGGKYRLNEGVDIEGPAANAGNTYNIGYVDNGEWLDYTINVAQAGDYQLRLRFSSPYATATTDVLFNGVNATGTLAVPNTGGWGNFTDILKTVTLAAGTQVMHIDALTGNFNMDMISLTPVAALTAPEQPFGGDGRGLPLYIDDNAIYRIEAENYDTGGNGVGYNKAIDNRRSIVAADFNGDGKADLAVTDYDSNSVGVLLNSGTGTLATMVEYATGAEPISVTAADFNGDGKIDLAVANYYNNTVSILLNNGNGTFAPKVDYATAAGPMGVVPGDFNGDGKMDLAVADYTANKVSILLNKGNGTFNAKVDYTTGTGPYSVTAADLSGDGKADLAVANNTANSVSVLLGTGTGTFGAKTDYATGTAPRSVTAADLSGDGKIDLATANSSANTVSVLLNAGTGTFTPKTDYATGAGPYSVTAADLNADGAIDLAVADDAANTVSVLLNSGPGTGTFGPSTDYATDLGPYAITTADLSADGKIDLAVANTYTNTANVFVNTGAGAFAAHADSVINFKTSTATLNAQPFRPTDLISTQGGGTGIVTVYWKAGDWLQWTLYTATAGTYEVRLTYARGDTGSSYATLGVNGTPQVTNLALPSTADWNGYTTVSTVLTLAAGKNVIRFTSASVGQINFDYFDINRSMTYGNGGASYYLAASGATKIEAENFDMTPGAAYDTTAGNSGGASYRAGTDVDIEATLDTGGGYDITHTAAGEYLTYTVRAQLTGYYFLSLRTAGASGGAVRILFNGVDQTGLITLPATLGDQDWTTTQVRILFQSGLQPMQIQVVAGGFNLNWITLQKDPNTAAVLADPTQLGSYAAEPPDAALNSVSDLYNRVYVKQYDWINQPAGAPVPTNDWWTNILESTFAGGLWPFPMQATTAANGVNMTYYNGVSNTAANITTTGGQSLRVTGQSGTFTRDALVSYGDWTVQFRMEQSSSVYMDVTLGRGIPYAWFEFTGIAPSLNLGGSYPAYSATGAALTGTFTTDHFRFSTALGQQFGVFAPAGTTFNLSGGTCNVTFSGSARFLVIAALPDATSATLDTFYQHAYAIPRGSTYGWAYNATAGTVATTWNLTTQVLMAGKSADTIQGWLPHDYQGITSGPTLLPGYSYPTINGPILLSVGQAFTITQPTTGLAFELPVPQAIGGTADYNAAQMAYYIAQYAATGPVTSGTYGNDTYWGGKDLQQMAEYTLMAKQIGDSHYTVLLGALRTAMTDWLTYTPGETAHYFAMYPDTGSLTGFSPAYGSENFTDNHFHYGYITSAAGVLALLDPTWGAQYGAMATLVAKQYANWDRTDTRLPFLRTFEPWSGHSYAGGTGDARGNNQEAASEAIQSWQGLVLLGQALNDPAMTAAGIMGYTLESKAELDYWWGGPNQSLFPAGYARSNVAINYDDSKGYYTFFGTAPEYVFGIEGLPLWPSMDFLGRYPSTMQAAVINLFQQRVAYYGDATDNTWASFEAGGGVNDWLNVCLGMVSTFDPQQAAVEYARMWTAQTATGKANTTGIYYYQDQSYRTYGVRDWNYHLSVPLGGVYTNPTTGKRSYFAFNAGTTAETVQVLDAAGNVLDSFTAAPQTSTLVQRVLPAVAGRYVSDSGTIDATKAALLPGQTASAANRTAYANGLTSVTIDISRTANWASVGAADFVFKVGTSGSAGSWALAPAPQSVSVIHGGGTGGSDRVTITWAAGAIQDEWLQVTFLGDAHTGLATADTFYFGNLRADGNGDGIVDGEDYGVWQNGYGHTGATATSGDYNGDGIVDGEDYGVWQNRYGSSLVTFVAADDTVVASSSDAATAPAAAALVIADSSPAAAPAPVAETPVQPMAPIPEAGLTGAASASAAILPAAASLMLAAPAATSDTATADSLAMASMNWVNAVDRTPTTGASADPALTPDGGLDLLALPAVLVPLK